MTRPAIEKEDSTLRTCCNFITDQGALSIRDMMELTGFSDGCIRHAVENGVDQGYLTNGVKQPIIGRGNNKRLTYIRTKKPLPEVLIEAELVRPPVKIEPFRHWQDEAFFGPAPHISSEAHVKAHVYKQSMSIRKDELEAIA